MFTRGFFAKVYFQQTYFHPPGTTVPTIPSDLPPLVGMILNFGTMMGRR